MPSLSTTAVISSPRSACTAIVPPPSVARSAGCAYTPMILIGSATRSSKPIVDRDECGVPRPVSWARSGRRPIGARPVAFDLPPVGRLEVELADDRAVVAARRIRVEHGLHPRRLARLELARVPIGR